MKGKTFKLTDRQIEWIDAGASRVQIGASDYLRRVLDAQIDGTPATAQPSTDQAVQLQPQEPDPSGTVMVRLWRSSHASLVGLSGKSGLTQIDILDRLLRAPDDVVMQILAGEFGGNEEIAEVIPGPIDPLGESAADKFLATICVTAKGLVVGMDDVYISYEHYCEEVYAEPIKRAAFSDYLTTEYGFIANRQSSTYSNLGLRTSAWACTVHGAKGYKLD